MAWDQLADGAAIQKAVTSLKAHNIEASVVSSGVEAKAKVLELIPTGAEVMTMSSATLEALGLTAELNESGKYNAVKKKLLGMDRMTQGREMQRLGASPNWAVGSVHAVTVDGHVLVASNSGSQLPAYVYAAGHVVWVVGTQKIVENTEAGIKRIYEYCLPLEDARAKKAYGTGSNVNKLLIINADKLPGRLTMILVKEKLGF